VHEGGHHEMKRKTFNAKIKGCFKQKNERKEWPLRFFTFEIVR
jgi:hypothetical protein